MAENKLYSLKEHPELESRMGGWLYNFARNENLELSETDVQWIERNITSHKLFRVINCDVYPYGHPNLYAYVGEFFSMFLDISGIPSRVNNLLIYVIGVCREYDKNQYGAPIEPTRIFFIDSWMRKTRGGGVKKQVLSMRYIKYSVAG